MNWLSLSVVFNVVMIVAVIVIIKAMGDTIIKFEIEKLKLIDKLIIREQQLMAEKMRNITSSKSSSPPLDTKTMSLLVLAVSNTNENEARSAAMQVCKRLKKKL